jgi:hypothetical protein
MSIVRPFITCFVAALFLTAGVASAQSTPEAVDAWVWSNAIQFPSGLHAAIEHTLLRSATFRAQYRRIAEAGSVVVGVTVNPTLCDSYYRARSTVRRYASGLTVVAVVIRQMCGSAVPA